MEFSRYRIDDFLSVLAAKDAVPGGGGASALVGALGTALGNMVGSLTVGKKKYADVEADIIALKEKADALQKDFLRLVEEDAKVFCEKAKEFELLLVASDSFGCPGYVRISYCVSTSQIQRSLPAFKKLAETYGLCGR